MSTSLEVNVENVVADLPNILTWQQHEDVPDIVFAGYVRELSDALGRLLRRAKKDKLFAGQQALKSMRDASPEAFLRVLTAPEVAHCLFLPNEVSMPEALDLLIKAFHAEELRKRPDRYSRVTPHGFWTILGDNGYAPDGRRLGFSQVPRLSLLDFGSPQAARLDLEGNNSGEAAPYVSFSTDEMAVVVNRLEDVCDHLSATAPSVLRFVHRLIRVIVMKKDSQNNARFASGSNADQPGRVMLINPHLSRLNTANLADAVVHEAIHALLTMLEVQQPWARDKLDKLAYNQTVTSPWSGRELHLFAYLHACFVWYGLFCLWTLPLKEESIDAATAADHAEIAASGFRGAPLTQALTPWQGGLDPRILVAIDEMQDRVRIAL